MWDSRPALFFRAVITAARPDTKPEEFMVNPQLRLRFLAAEAGPGLVPLRVVVLVAVQLVRVVGRHVGEVLEDVLVRFIS